MTWFDQRGHAQPAAFESAELLPSVSGVDVATPRSSSRRGWRIPSAHQPPSSACPKTASTPSVSSSDPARVSSAESTCGVSIPTSRVGDGSHAQASSNAPASRSSNSPARCGVTRRCGGTHAAGSPPCGSSLERTRHGGAFRFWSWRRWRCGWPPAWTPCSWVSPRGVRHCSRWPPGRAPGAATCWRSVRVCYWGAACISRTGWGPSGCCRWR